MSGGSQPSRIVGFQSPGSIVVQSSVILVDEQTISWRKEFGLIGVGVGVAARTINTPVPRGVFVIIVVTITVVLPLRIGVLIAFRVRVFRIVRVKHLFSVTRRLLA